MADGNFPTLVSRTRDANAATNVIYVQLSDGSASIGVTSNALDVNIDNTTIAVTQSGTWNIATVTTLTGITNDVNIADGGNSITVDDGGTTISIDDGGGAITVDGTVTATVDFTFDYAEDAVHASGDVGAFVLAVRNDTLAALAGTDGDYAPFQVNANGALYVEDVSGSLADDAAFGIGSDSVVASGFLADDAATDSVDEGDIGIARMTLDRRQLMVITDATTDSQRLAIDSSGNAQVDLAAVSVTAVPVSKDANANTETNPIFVKLTDTAISGVEVVNYDTQAALAADTTDNHDYTVTGTTFFLKSVIFSSSGGGKVEVQTGPVASLATKAVAFVPKHGGTVQLDFSPAVEVPVTSTGTVRLIRTNREGTAQDVYSTILGNDV